MWWIVLICIVVFAWWIIIATKNEFKRQRDEGIIYSSMGINYIGGFKDISGGKSIKFDLTKTQIKITFSSQQVKIINLSDVVDAECSTEDNISREIGLGSLIVFGIFSLGMKRSKHIVRKFAVVKFIQEGKETGLVLEMNPDIVISKILELKKKSKEFAIIN